MQRSLARRRSAELSVLTEPFLPAQASHELTVDLCFVIDTQPSSYFRLGIYKWQDLVANLQQIAEDHASHRPLVFETGLELQHLLHGDKLILLRQVPVASAALSACKQLEQAVNRTYALCRLQPLPYKQRRKSGASGTSFLMLDLMPEKTSFQLQPHYSPFFLELLTDALPRRFR